MKTLVELIGEANEIKKRADDLQAALREIEESQNSQKNNVDIKQLMQRAKANEIEGHILSKRSNDSIIVEAYIVLLLSLASVNVSNNSQNDSAMYPCRIAAGLNPVPDMELMLKKMLVLDEQYMLEQVETIKSNDLKYAFMLDALITISMYEKNNLGRQEFLVELASLLEVTKEEFLELINLLKIILSGYSELIYLKLTNIDENQIFPYLDLYKFCDTYILDTKTKFICSSKSGADITDCFDKFCDISKKTVVQFKNITLKGTKQDVKVCDSVELIFEKCKVISCNGGIFYSKNVGQIKILSSQFDNCTRYCDGEGPVGKHLPFFGGFFGDRQPNPLLNEGVIGTLNKINSVYIFETLFKNCYVHYSKLQRRPSEYGAESIYDDTWFNKLFYGIDESQITAESCEFEEQNCELV